MLNCAGRNILYLSIVAALKVLCLGIVAAQSIIFEYYSCSESSSYVLLDIQSEIPAFQWLEKNGSVVQLLKFVQQAQAQVVWSCCSLPTPATQHALWPTSGSCVYELGLHSLSFTKHSNCTKSFLPPKHFYHPNFIITLDLALTNCYYWKYFYISFICVEVMLPNASVDGTSCSWPRQPLLRACHVCLYSKELQQCASFMPQYALS